MADLSHPPKSPTLVPPRKSVELEDPGAHDMEASEAEDDVFSDAQEARNSHSGPNSPIPKTRVEKADEGESYAQSPSTDPHKTRELDAVPERHQSPNMRDLPIPKMVVEKVDTQSPSHGDVPGTAAHAKRQADAVPDVILQAPEHDAAPVVEDRGGNITPDIPIPTTVITKVDSKPSHGEVPGTDAFDMRKGDAKPDVIEKKGDISDPSFLTPSGQNLQ